MTRLLSTSNTSNRDWHSTCSPVQNSRFLADGALDPAFVNFGLAWYQSDIQVGKSGSGSAKINTILVNQIFGFDPEAALPPTNTFHVGFWFNNPADAAACGFTGTTPFNGEHNAGPLAMESVPDATTDFGPSVLEPNVKRHLAATLEFLGRFELIGQDATGGRSHRSSSAFIGLYVFET
jgi:hypothetical protein